MSLKNNFENFRPWLMENQNLYDAILFDVDGTLFAGDHVLPGAVETIDRLRADNFPFRLLTNDGNHSPQEKSAMMRRAGLKILPREIVSCSMALNSFVADNGFANELFFVMGDLGEPCYAENAGLRVTRKLNEIDSCRGVIVGEGIYDWRGNINAVLNSLAAIPNRPLVVPNPDSHWPNGPNGEIGVGAGGKARFIQMILADMGVAIEPIYLGKPHPAIYEYAVRVLRSSFGLDENPRVLMLGDSLRSDIQGANAAGMSSALILTGITNQKQVDDAPPHMKPRLVFKCL